MSEPTSPFFKTQTNFKVSGIKGDPRQIGKSLQRPNRPPLMTKVNFLNIPNKPVAVQPRIDFSIVSRETMPLACPMPILI